MGNTNRSISPFRGLERSRPVTGAAATMALACLISACGGGDDDETPLTASAACAQLNGTSVPAGSIALPTRGATVQTTFVPAGSASSPSGAPVPTPEYCKATGAIASVDVAAPPINFQVNLPTNWNTKALHRGGTGFNGTVVTAEGDVPFQFPSATPLGRGYATFGSDSGHQGDTLLDGSWALNDEALANFGANQLKKTRDVAMFLINARYSAIPTRTYFAGNSQGGHEAFLVVQRWPKDYDGAYALHPVYNLATLSVSGISRAKAVYSPGGWVSPAKYQTVRTAVFAACDGLDNVVDNIISNATGCATAFNVQTLRCPMGADTGDTCLSDQQIATLNGFNTRLNLGYTAQGGLTSLARAPIYEGGDYTGLWTLGTRPVPSMPPTPTLDMAGYTFSDPMVRFFITRNPAFNSLTFDPSANIARLIEVSNLVDANSVDIAAFRDRGGKLLLLHGTVDPSTSPWNSVDYFQRLQARFGQASLDQFVKFYLVPGFGHPPSFGTFTLGWDALGTLEAWVERGVNPGDLVATDLQTVGTPQMRTRPLCVYPRWPRYSGAGDVNQASNFNCVTN